MPSEGDQPMVTEAARRSGIITRGSMPILLGVATGLALCALVYFALTFAAGPAPGPAPTARSICADLTSQRYDALYGLLSPDMRRLGTQAQFIASQRELDSLLGPVHTCHATVNSNSGGVAAITLTLQRGQAAPVGATLSLMHAQSAWTVTAYDQNF